MRQSPCSAKRWYCFPLMRTTYNSYFSTVEFTEVPLCCAWHFWSPLNIDIDDHFHRLTVQLQCYGHFGWRKSSFSNCVSACMLIMILNHVNNSFKSWLTKAEDMLHVCARVVVSNLAVFIFLAVYRRTRLRLWLARFTKKAYISLKWYAHKTFVFPGMAGSATIVTCQK